MGVLAAALDPLGIVRSGGVTAASAATTASVSPSPPKTTLEKTIGRFDAGGGYNKLALNAGEGYIDRYLFNGLPQGGTANKLIAFAQISDMQIVDVKSPMRLEYADKYHDIDDRWPFDSSYRPQEMLSTQLTDSMVRAIRNIDSSPGLGLPLKFTIVTGDAIDNAQENETEWYISLLDGNTVHPDSGDFTRNDHVSSIDLGLDTSRYYWQPEGLIDDVPNRFSLAGFPLVPGLLAAARRSFKATGLGMPWYAAFGNHDMAVQGNFPPGVEPYPGGFLHVRERALDTEKIVELPDFDTTYPGSDTAAGTAVGEAIILHGPRTRTVAADPKRKILSKAEFIQKHWNTIGTPLGHGFQQNSALGYYVIPGANYDDLFKFIALDTTNVTNIPAHGGWVDPVQFSWLESELRACHSRFRNTAVQGGNAGSAPGDTFTVQPGVQDKLVVLYMHHTLDTMNNLNTGSDGFKIGWDGLALRNLCLRFPNVIMVVNGHTHANNITPHGVNFSSDNHNGFWEINTASHIDWPIQSRIIEVAEQEGVLTIFTTMVDANAPLDFQGDLSTPTALAALGRELATNDPSEIERGIDLRRGENPNVRNTRLKLPTPFAIPLVGSDRGALAAVAGSDGRLRQFRVDINNRLWTDIQTTVNSSSWSGWEQLDGKTRTIAAQLNGENRFELFGVSTSGRILHRWELIAGSGQWSPWADFGDSPLVVPMLTVSRGPSGGLTLFGTDSFGVVWGCVQYTTNSGGSQGQWSPWGKLDGGVTTIAAQANSDGRIELFGATTGGKILHRWEVTVGTGQWSPWVDFGPSPLGFPMLSVSRAPGGGLAVLGADPSGAVWGRSQYTIASGTSQGSWSGWSRIDGLVSRIAAQCDADGRIELLGADNFGKLFRRHELTAGTGTWSPWTTV